MDRDELHAHAERLGIPRRTLEQVREALAKAAETDADQSMARLLAKHGRLTPEAEAYVAEYLDPPVNLLTEMQARGLR